MKKVTQILPADKINMDGNPILQALPKGIINQIDPFLLVHHWTEIFEGGDHPKRLGVGPHPHRGFTPVSLVFKGGLRHQDSRGNDEVVWADGTQWMHSGMGIVHSERPAQKIAEEGGELELIQFWINSPAQNKMDQPHYQSIAAGDTPTLNLANGKAKIGVVAGQFQESKGSIQTLIPLLILRLDLKKYVEIEIPVSEIFNSFIYLLDGKLIFNNKQEGLAHDLVRFETGPAPIQLKALEDTRAVLLAGQPINEKITKSGPFVMNTQTEILEAMRDYQMGKMGILIED